MMNEDAFSHMVIGNLGMLFCKVFWAHYYVQLSAFFILICKTLWLFGIEVRYYIQNNLCILKHKYHKHILPFFGVYLYSFSDVFSWMTRSSYGPYQYHIYFLPLHDTYGHSFSGVFWWITISYVRVQWICLSLMGFVLFLRFERESMRRGGERGRKNLK